ncbi:hypothetical protein SAMN05216298_0307 [Glycomyces sambucus]|uniref:Uncharacterized protein n=1 Tax=Glycomyces sambucus TaxID=380244 RepID=A0A1G9CFF2_9ACTN|nr:hypothetical protein [Glycomyces sambucus]SDK50388.1 hypothetical protein SAMN05216298_0307 [Glycomyces sambucus]
MKAHQFDYWVSRQHAAQFPATARPGPKTKTVPTWVQGTTWAAAACFLFGGIAVWNFADRADWADVVYGITCTLSVLTVIVASFMHMADSGESRVDDLMRQYPWQAWPCRMDNRSEFHILDPEQNIIQTFKNIDPLPTAGWRNITDGIGVIWICGDLREDVLVASVGGKPSWRAKPNPERSLPGQLTEPQQALLASAIKFAAAAAMQVWISPP